MNQKIKFSIMAAIASVTNLSSAHGDTVYMCLPCPAGYSCSKGVKTPCPSGTYSPNGSSSCTTCPAGTYSGKTSASCNKCQDYYWSSPGSSSCGQVKIRLDLFHVNGGIPVSRFEKTLTLKNLDEGIFCVYGNWGAPKSSLDEGCSVGKGSYWVAGYGGFIQSIGGCKSLPCEVGGNLGKFTIYSDGRVSVFSNIGGGLLETKSGIVTW